MEILWNNIIVQSLSECAMDCTSPGMRIDQIYAITLIISKVTQVAR